MLHPVLGQNWLCKSWASATGCCLSPYFPTVLLPPPQSFLPTHYMFHLPTCLFISKQVLHFTQLYLRHLLGLCTTASSELCILDCDSFWQKTPLTGQQREWERKERFLRNCNSIPHFWETKGNCSPLSHRDGVLRFYEMKMEETMICWKNSKVWVPTSDFLWSPILLQCFASCSK